MKVVGVIGAGQMGRGIAQVAATNNFIVKLFDVDAKALENGHTAIKKLLERNVEKGRLDSSGMEKILANIVCIDKLEDFSDAELVVEAIVEKKEIKQKVFKQLEKITPTSCVLASNTSSISITEMANVLEDPSRVVGIHFMNPVPVMKLVEIISSPLTSGETLEKAQSWVRNLHKTQVLSKDYPGFIVNRILMPMINEAFFTLFEGVASAEDIDSAMVLGTNCPMGPLTLADFIGLDTCLYILNVLHDGLGDPKYRPCPLLKNYVAAGKLGKKTGCGVYTY